MFLGLKSKSCVLAGIMGLCCAMGCGDAAFHSHFVSSESTESLMKEAQQGYKGHKGVEELVKERFGTPQQLNYWLKMPLDAGGVTGVIAETPDSDAAIKSLQLQLDAALPEGSEEGGVLQIVTGAAAEEVVAFESWSPDTGICELAAPMQAAPAAGDQVIVGGGEVLQDGRVLYMRHCAHCHGTSGDGAGPTAVYLYPRPRDYRNGIFKFTSTKSLMRPRREDIHRILKNGIPGTYMPSFVPMLNEEELATVVEYVRFLAMRGEFERKIAGEFSAEYSKEEYRKRIEDGESRKEILEALEMFFEEDLPDFIEMDSDDVASAWESAEEEGSFVVPSVPRTEDTPESRRRGRELFVGAKLNCVNCHGIGGRGNGPQTREYELVDGKPRPEPGLHDEWGHLVKPRNLTTGIYRGGRRPIDIFRRLYSGINGAKMPAFGGKVSDAELWDVVNYVLSLPFEPKPGHSPAPEEASTASL